MKELNKKRMNNMKEQFNKPGVKMILITSVALASAAVILGVVQTAGQQSAVAEEGNARSIRATGVQAAPGTVGDPAYQEAVRQQNQERAQQAATQGGTFVPTIQGTSEVRPIDPFSNASAQAPVVDPRISGAVPVVNNVQRVNEQNQAQAQNQGGSSGVKGSDQYKSIEKQFLGYMQAWTAPVSGSEFNFNGTLPATAEPAASGGSAATAAPGAASSGSAASAENTGARFLRAGTVVPAVVLSCVNSKEPGPVLAQIFNGPLAGSRVIGGFTTGQDGKSLILQFSTISMPGENRSFGMDAYAVEEDLSIGMATDVNNHYFRRYGLRLAAGFVQGYGQAIGSQNTTTTVTDGGAVVISRGELDTSQINRQALGEAASNVAQSVDELSNVQPTVKLCGKDGAGVPIGLLFMSDF